MPYQQIGGSLNSNDSGANLFQGAGNAQATANNYASDYRNSLKLNEDKYNQTLSGYQTGLTNMQNTQQGITADWGNLSNNVLGLLGIGQGGAVGSGGAVGAATGAGGTGAPAGNWGVASAAANQIARTETANQGLATQRAISSGLGNSTVLSSLSRGAAYDASQAYGSLGAQLAQTGAGYMSSLGSAALNYRNQANMQNAAWQGNQLKFMEDTKIPYPNQSSYGSLYGAELAHQYGGGAAGSRPAVVNPYGSSSHGSASTGHTPFISGSPGSPPSGQIPQQQAGRPPAAPQLIRNPGSQSLSDQYAEQSRQRQGQWDAQVQAMTTGAPVAYQAADGSVAYYDPYTGEQMTVGSDGTVYDAQGNEQGTYDSGGGYTAADEGGYYGGDAGGGE